MVHSFNERGRWNMMILPQNKHSRVVELKSATSCSVSKQEQQAERSTNTNSFTTLLCYVFHLPFNKRPYFFPSVQASHGFSWLPNVCSHCVTTGPVLALILSTQYCRHPRQYKKNMASLWGRTNGQRHGNSKYLAVIFLTVLWWRVIFHSTRHKTQHPTNNTFSQAEVRGPFLNHNKTWDLRA